MAKNRGTPVSPDQAVLLYRRAFWVCMGLALLGLVLGALFWVTYGYETAFWCLIGSLLPCVLGLTLQLEEKALRRQGAIPPHERW